MTLVTERAYIMGLHPDWQNVPQQLQNSKETAEEKRQRDLNEIMRLAKRYNDLYAPLEKGKFEV